MWGVGPAVSTGKPCSTYWPGGSRAARSSETRRRPVKPREMNPATALSFQGTLSKTIVTSVVARSSCRDDDRRASRPQSGDRGRDACSSRGLAERAGLDGLADDACDDVRLRQHDEVRGALDLGDRGTGALVGEPMER